MRGSYRDEASGVTRSKRGTGSLRERHPGVWEVRVVVGFDPGRARSGRTQRVTLGSGTADMIRRHFQAWAARVEPEQDWLFSLSPRRSTCMTADALSHRLTRLAPASGVEHPALHRLRHGVATYLVDQGRLLKAQARASATATPPPRYGTTPMPPRSMTPTSPTSLTASSTAWTQPSDHSE